MAQKDNESKFQKLIDFVTKHKSLSIFIIILVFILCLTIIQIPFWIGSEYSLGTTYFSPNDILTFTGSFLSLIGTLFLGGLVYRQNSKFKKDNDASQQSLNNAVSKLSDANQIIAKANEEANSLSNRLIELENEKYRPMVYIETFSSEDIDTTFDCLRISVDNNYANLSEKFELIESSSTVYCVKLCNPKQNKILNIKEPKIIYRTKYNNSICLGEIQCKRYNYNFCSGIPEKSWIGLLLVGLKQNAKFPYDDEEKLVDEDYTNPRLEVEMQLILTSYIGKEFIHKMKFYLHILPNRKNGINYPFITDFEIL